MKENIYKIITNNEEQIDPPFPSCIDISTTRGRKIIYSDEDKNLSLANLNRS